MSSLEREKVQRGRRGQRSKNAVLGLLYGGVGEGSKAAASGSLELNLGNLYS